jgi:hypothetical protein
LLNKQVTGLLAREEPERILAESRSKHELFIIHVSLSLSPLLGWLHEIGEHIPVGVQKVSQSFQLNNLLWEFLVDVEIYENKQNETRESTKKLK